MIIFWTGGATRQDVHNAWEQGEVYDGGFVAGQVVHDDAKKVDTDAG